MSEPSVQLPLLREAGALVVDPGPPFVQFELAGEPRAWSRARSRIVYPRNKPAFIHYYIDSAETEYREAIGWMARAAMRGCEPTNRPVAMIVHAFLPIPQSWSWRKQQAARAGVILPTGKPDFDNLAKIVADSIKGIVLGDDASVIDGRCIKRFSDKPAMRAEIREFVSPK